MLNLGITLIVVGLFSLVLPMFGRQFLVVTAFVSPGISASIVGLVIFSIGALFVYVGIKKEQKEIMRNGEIPIAQQRLRQEPKFKVEDDSIMSKSVFYPREFGMEITNLSFAFSVEQFEKHIFTRRYLSAEIRQASLIRKNPEPFQAFLALLFIGAVHCYIRVILRAGDKVLEEFCSGISDGLRSKVPVWGDDIIEAHKLVAVNFSIALLREIRQTDQKSSTNLFLKYLLDIYPDAKDFFASEGLISYLDGLGTKFMAICQNIFKVRILGLSTS